MTQSTGTCLNHDFYHVVILLGLTKFIINKRMRWGPPNTGLFYMKSFVAIV